MFIVGGGACGAASEGTLAPPSLRPMSPRGARLRTNPDGGDGCDSDGEEGGAGCDSDAELPPAAGALAPELPPPLGGGGWLGAGGPSAAADPPPIAPPPAPPAPAPIAAPSPAAAPPPDAAAANDARLAPAVLAARTAPPTMVPVVATKSPPVNAGNPPITLDTSLGACQQTAVKIKPAPMISKADMAGCGAAGTAAALASHPFESDIPRPMRR